MPQLPNVHLLDGVDESGRIHGSSEPELNILTDSTSPLPNTLSLDGSEEAEGFTSAVRSSEPQEALSDLTMISGQLDINDAPPELPVDAGVADLLETRNCAEEKQSFIQRQEEEEGDEDMEGGEEEEEEAPLEAKVEEEETDHEETKLLPPFTDANETESEAKATSPPTIADIKVGEVVIVSDLDGPVSEEEPTKAARRMFPFFFNLSLSPHCFQAPHAAESHQRRLYLPSRRGEAHGDDVKQLRVSLHRMQ
jgi:bromodomain-containing protein 8